MKYFFLIYIFFKGSSMHANANRENILDRKESVTEQTVLTLPFVPPLCDQIKNLQKTFHNVGDAKIYVETEGHGTTILLINGGPGGTHNYFHPWFSKLNDIAQIIYYDQRGTGKSDFSPGKNGYSVKQAIDDIEFLRKKMGIKSWTIIGYSYGGFLAQFYTTHYPESVNGLILLSSAPGVYSDIKESRQNTFITENEKKSQERHREKIKIEATQNKWDRKLANQIGIYNSYKNGSWKRQSFYKPTEDELLQMALYSWVNDIGFNQSLNNSLWEIDLTGAFDKNPIPTLISEGEWDLTWGENKIDVLKKNHPNAKMIVFKNAAHSIFDENSEDFFREIRTFILSMPTINKKEIEQYKNFLNIWRKTQADNPNYFLFKHTLNNENNKKIANKFKTDWLQQNLSTQSLLNLTLALFQQKNFEHSILVSKSLVNQAKLFNLNYELAVAHIWLGHAYDISGKRDLALQHYNFAKQIKIEPSSNSHDYLGLKFEIDKWIIERLSSPFSQRNL